MAQELLLRAGILGRSELTFRCDNDPILLQLLDLRTSMGYKGSLSSYSHANGLVETVIGRIRPLAGTLMWHMSEQVGGTFQATALGGHWRFAMLLG